MVPHPGAGGCSRVLSTSRPLLLPTLQAPTPALGAKPAQHTGARRGAGENTQPPVPTLGDQDKSEAEAKGE